MGQGPSSPFKPRPGVNNQQASNAFNNQMNMDQMNMVMAGLNNVSLAPFKSLTPMPKLTHAFSQPAPEQFKKQNSLTLNINQIEQTH